MNVTRFIQTSAVGLLLLCSCATQDSVRPNLPAEIPFNKAAGFDQRIYLTLHMENGKALLFYADTGVAYTVLDKSLEPILGKCLGLAELNYSWNGKVIANVYDAPKLYLGSTPLLLGHQIYTDDMSSRWFEKRKLMGVLGMDCLRHYCIQLDLAAHKMRFLDPDHPGIGNSGRQFPLAFRYGQPWIDAKFPGRSYASFMVDTGDPDDAYLKPKLFERAAPAHLCKSSKSSAGVLMRTVFFPEMVFNGAACTNFTLGDCPDKNGLGLRFLSRHLTTLNFPKRTLYLQPGEIEPFVADGADQFLPGSAFTQEAIKFIINLVEKNQLPGWLKDEHGEINCSWKPDKDTPEVYPISRSFMGTKKGDVSQYQYTVVKTPVGTRGNCKERGRRIQKVASLRSGLSNDHRAA
jgi:hypothetical protein